ncbi:MAG TPA: hypothetical protein VK886_12770 [Vicinamibacterales bacterium]|nr:hypothetical protein [Vicinamibacterales bacterium]
MLRPIVLILAVLAGGAAADSGQRSDRFDAELRLSMASYYAALLASAHGNAEATLRHLVLFRSRWEQLARGGSRQDSPAWFGADVRGEPIWAAVASKIEVARRQLPRNVTGAHAELEAIRLLLRDARARHGALGFDDALTEYHDAMERVLSLAGGRNEIALTASDFGVLGGAIKRAEAGWSAVESSRGAPKGLADWKDIAAGTASALRAAAESAKRQDAAAVQHASEDLRNRYDDLLRILSRWQ